ncbi:hypothetical protein [Roseovarius sp. TE539]|uniref:hypothetical protein n=1 Tax=Roseovarius sp. TE539 TaxID=2249812 RepID=UPI0011BF7B37|nr:hypothetical protein [Roseovarius sp. TE539]
MSKLDWSKNSKKNRVLQAGYAADESARKDTRGLGRRQEPKSVIKQLKGVGKPSRFTHVKDAKKTASKQLAMARIEMQELAAKGLEGSESFEKAKRKVARLKREHDPVGEYRKKMSLVRPSKKAKRRKARRHA